MINKNKLFSFGINQKRVDLTLKFGSKDPYVFLNKLLVVDNKLDVFVLSLIKINGEKKFIQKLSKLSGFKTVVIQSAFDSFIESYQSEDMLLTGGEAVALLIKKAGIKYIFAYPGTSELVFCDSILRTPGLNIINGRGDKESAFMAMGGSFLSPNRAAAILHGARGLTNATGAIADAYRNEVGTVFFVGLPSTSSAPFLPPHGEKNLLKGIGVFVKKTYEIRNKVVDMDSSKRKKKIVLSFLQTVSRGIIDTKKLPIGPVVIGLPQDIIEQRWVPMEEVCNIKIIYSKSKQVSKNQLEHVLRLIRNKRHPIIIIDDYFLKDDKAKKSLVKFAASIQAPVLQIRYLRGPMLFERLSVEQNPYFVGSYMVDNKIHKKLMSQADVLILLEDRNAYSRILGVLPNCPKVTITSNSIMTRKNAYLNEGDVLISGKVSEIITTIAEKFGNKTKNLALADYCCAIRKKTGEVKLEIDKRYKFMRQDIGEVLAGVFKNVSNPLLVDDSQMFGGLIFESYDKFRDDLRVFGDHGAFIGGGISLAAGLAICNLKCFTIFCTIGDQSFTNAMQGLVSVVQEKVKIIYIVCNNGKSVSLLKQIFSQDKHAFDDGNDTFLCNVSGFEYAKVAKQIGLNSYKLCFSPGNSVREDIKMEFRNILMSALRFNGPSLIELVLPSDPVAWKGIWATQGKEPKPNVSNTLKYAVERN
jgi:acetolactate synthase I/II/III large subunit